MTDIDGILLCGIAASGTNAPTNATFHGFTTFGTNVSTAASLPKYDSYANVTMDATWQPLRSISIVTTGKLQGPSMSSHLGRWESWRVAAAHAQAPSDAKSPSARPHALHIYGIYRQGLMPFICPKLATLQC